MAGRKYPNMTPTEGKKQKQEFKQAQVTDLNTLTAVTLRKYFSFEPVPDSADFMAQVLARLGNDTKRLQRIINDGLLSEQREAVVSDASIPWQTIDDKGKVVGPFTGLPANQKLINGTILSIAKSSFGFNKKMTAEEKADAKEQAKEAIRTSPVIMAGLKKQAAAAPLVTEDEEDEKDDE